MFRLHVAIYLVDLRLLLASHCHCLQNLGLQRTISLVSDRFDEQFILSVLPQLLHNIDFSLSTPFATKHLSFLMELTFTRCILSQFIED